PAEAGDVEVGPAIVVVVANGAGHGEARSSDAGLVGDVGKSSVVIDMVESAAALLAFDGHLDARGIGEIDVGPAVAIIVEQNHAAAHGLHDVFLGGVGAVLEGDAGLRGDVFQLWNRATQAFDGFSSGRRRWWRGMALL